MEKKEKKAFNLRLSPELYDKVAEYSKKEMRTATNSINYIIERFFDEAEDIEQGHKEQK